MSRSARVLSVAAAVLVGLALGWLVPSMTSSRAPEQSTQIAGFLWPDPPAVTDFQMTDHDGQAFDRARLLGRWSMLYFGYTHCPDACPISLSVMREVEKLLASNDALNAPFQGVFVSVDPARDTLSHLATYVGYFSPQFVGATAPADAIARVARQFGVAFTLNEPDPNGGYLVDHSSSFLLVDPKGRLVAVLRTPHEASELASRIERIHNAVAG